MFVRLARQHIELCAASSRQTSLASEFRQFQKPYRHYQMKALVLAAIVAAFLSVDAFGQSYDSTVDGVRTIASKSEWVRSGMTDKHPLQLSVVAVQNPDSGQWHHSLSVGVSSMISEATEPSIAPQTTASPFPALPNFPIPPNTTAPSSTN